LASCHPTVRYDTIDGSWDSIPIAVGPGGVKR
jgi:hypothetical protein